MKILAFAASNSSKSINKQLLRHAISFLPDEEVELIDINDFELPIYSQDIEEASGIPQAAKDFLAKIADADALLISFAEHNGNYTAAYKNLFDWASREHREVYQDKPVVMLATSPGPGGAKNVLAIAENSASIFAANVQATMSIPKFYDNFDTEQGQLKDAALTQQLKTTVEAIRETVSG